MGNASAIPLTTRNAMDGHSMGTATDVNLYTSFTFTRRCTEKGSEFDRHHTRDEESDGYQE